ncbi:MAG TPA: amidohydrolase family protein [Candidatus Aminicenantes bacterium]|nr:amidohydrolase family protein [Candidatus Aminicenantes bacterium]
MRAASFAALAAGLALAAVTGAAAPDAGPDKALVIRGGRVVTAAGPEIENGAVLVEGGKIKAVGGADAVAAPPGAEVVDASGRWVLPGLVECLASIGLGERYEAGEGEELSDPVAAGLRLLDALDPFDKRFGQAARAGITTLMVAPGRANVIGAQAVVVKPRGATAEEMALPGPAGVKLTLGEGPKSAFGAKGRLPGTRMGSAFVVRKALLEAAEYARKRRDHQAAVAAAKGKKGAEPPAAPPRRLDLEPLADLLDGRLTAFIECHRADDIQTALRLVDEFRFRAVLVGATEAYKSAGEIARRGIPVVVGVMGVGPKRVETKDVSLGNAAALVAAGVKTAIAAEDALGVGAQEELALSAALAVKGGLDRASALRAVTLTAAEVLGVASRVGSLEPGKDADIVVLDGDPFSYRTRVERVWIDGRPVRMIEPLK